MDIFLLSLPADEVSDRTLADKVGDLATISNLTIPQFKIGTLDQLIAQSEELGKLDNNFEQILQKVLDTLRSILQNDESKISQQTSISGQPMEKYIDSFRWSNKYRTDRSIPDLVEILSKEMWALDADLKSKFTHYQQAQGQLTSIKRRGEGNLSTKSLDKVVSKEHFVTDSEYLQTLLVAVPKDKSKQWLKSYEQLTEFVVPRSSTLIAQDSEFYLYNVTVFKKYVNDFTNKCRENKYVPRDFEFNEKDIEDADDDFHKLGDQEKKLWAETLRLAKSSFADAFESWVHLKVLRIFVESVLRYGLPPKFLSVALKPERKQEKRLKTVLDTNFSYIGGGGEKNEKLEMDNLGEYTHIMESDYTPYVFFPFKFSIKKES